MKCTVGDRLCYHCVRLSFLRNKNEKKSKNVLGGVKRCFLRNITRFAELKKIVWSKTEAVLFISVIISLLQGRNLCPDPNYCSIKTVQVSVGDTVMTTDRLLDDEIICLLPNDLEIKTYNVKVSCNYVLITDSFYFKLQLSLCISRQIS